MIESQLNVIGGVNLDKDPRSLKQNELSYAKDMEVTSLDAATDMSASPMPSSTEIYNIPSLSSRNQYLRVKFIDTVSSYTLYFKDQSGNNIGPGSFSVAVSPGDTATDFIADINTVLNPYSFTASFDDQQGDYISLALVSGSTPIPFTLTQIEVDGSVSTNIPIFMLQEYVNIPSALNRVFRPLQTIFLDNIMFVFSSVPNDAYGQIGYAVKDLNGDWTYTELVTSSELIFFNNKPIEIQGEKITNSQYAFYWINTFGKPKVIYVPDTLGQYAPLKYSMDSFEVESSGLFTLESIGQQTDLQIQNPSRPEFTSQNDAGGILDSGTYWYFTQVGINNDYSEWSVPTNPVAVFKEGVNSPSSGFNVRGDKTPQTTSKSNVITIKSANFPVYNKVRLGYVICQGGAYSGKIVGEYDVTANEFSIEHTGYESLQSDYDIGFFPPVQEVFTYAGNCQVKKNRFNLADVEVQRDANLESIFQNVTLGQDTADLNSTGYVTATETPLFKVSRGEYIESGRGEVSLNLSVNTANGDFNPSSAYFVAPDNWFVPPTNGDYFLTISLNGKLIGTGGFLSLYVVDLVTGVKVLEIPVGNQLTNTSYNFRKTLIVTLTTSMKLAYKYFVNNGSNINVSSISFVGTKVISDYNYKYLKAGEFQNSINIANKVGYMVNETYPFYARVHYKSGYISNWYYVGSYKFSGGSSLATTTNGFLSNISGDTLTYGLTINGLDISSIKDEILRIEIGRGLANQSVLGTGIFIPTHKVYGGNEGGNYNVGLYTGNTSGGSYGQNVANSSSNRYFGVMICPDWLVNGFPEYQNGDKIVNYGQQDATLASFLIAGANTKWGTGTDLNGRFVPFTTQTPQEIGVVDAASCDFNTSSRILENDAQSMFLSARLDQTGSVDTLSVKCMAMTLDTKIIPVSGTASGNDFGSYYVQYIRDIAEVNPKDLSIVSCGYFIEIDKSTPNILPEQLVFGGDTYTQKTYTKILYNAYNPDTASGGTLSSFVGYYSQNRINQQLRYVDTTFDNKPFPMGTVLNDYLFTTYNANEQFQIDRGYTWELPLNNGVAYNSKIIQEKYFRSRIYYSQQKPLGSIVDTYRTILPNDYKDLPAKNGKIVALYDTNDVMVAIQLTAVHVLPYQSDVVLSSADGSIYIGNGGVYSQREIQVSSYGSKFKTATLLAENAAGNLQVYWFSTTANAFLRYGPDGTKNLSEENNWRTYFLNKSKLCINDFDVVLGFDRNRKSVFITARAVNSDVPLYDSGVTYSIGDKVRYGALNKYKSFEQTLDVYQSKTNSNTGNNPFDSSANWEVIPETNVEYYNKWTAVWNEKYNYFTGELTVLPERYFNFNGIVIVPRGIPSYNSMYELFGGTTILQWLSNGTTFKQGTFIVEYSINTKGAGFYPERINGVGIQVGMNHNESNNPSVMVYTALQNEDNVSNGPSLMNPTDFEFLNGQIGVGVYPNAQDEIIIGDWVKVRYTSQLFYRIFSLVSKMYIKRRILSK
jgi:hypothetical protein